MWKLLFFSKNNGDKFGTKNPEKDLLDLLVEKTVSAGHMLSFKEASEDPEMVQPNNYVFYFGSFSEAARIAWFRARPSTSDSDGLTEQGRKLAQALKKHRQSTGKPSRREVDWMSEFKKNERRSKGARYTIGQVRKKLVEFYERTGRLPKRSDIADDSNGLPSWPTLINHLGPKAGWQAIIDKEKASLVPGAEDPQSSDALSSEKVKTILAEESGSVTALDKPIIGHDASVASVSYGPEESNIEEMSEGHGRTYTAH